MLRLYTPLLPPPWSPDSHPRVQRALATGLHHRQRQSAPPLPPVEDLHQVRVRFDPLVLHFLRFNAQGLMPCILPRMRFFYPPDYFLSIDWSKKIRFRFPPNASRTHRLEIFGSTDLALAIALVHLGSTEMY
jgi:hypothetical protein